MDNFIDEGYRHVEESRRDRMRHAAAGSAFFLSGIEATPAARQPIERTYT
jgi:hypothetical protein